MVQISFYISTTVLIASSQFVIGNSKDLVISLSFLWETHILQIKSSIFLICSWWVFVVKTMLLPQGPPHFSINTFLSKACTYSIIILDFYSPYCGFLQKTGFALPVSMENSYPRIVCFAPYLQKQSQYLITIAINYYFISGLTILFNLICLCSYSLYS